jgi:hypothetical protein
MVKCGIECANTTTTFKFVDSCQNLRLKMDCVSGGQRSDFSFARVLKNDLVQGNPPEERITIDVDQDKKEEIGRTV